VAEMDHLEKDRKERAIKRAEKVPAPVRKPDLKDSRPMRKPEVKKRIPLRSLSQSPPSNHSPLMSLSSKRRLRNVQPMRPSASADMLDKPLASPYRDDQRQEKGRCAQRLRDCTVEVSKHAARVREGLPEQTEAEVR